MDKNTHRSWPCARPGLMWLIAYSFIGQGWELKNNVMKREISTTRSRVYINQSANELHGAFKWGHGRQLRQVKCWAFFVSQQRMCVCGSFARPNMVPANCFCQLKPHKGRSQWRSPVLRVTHKFINLQHADDSQQIRANCDKRLWTQLNYSDKEQKKFWFSH